MEINKELIKRDPEKLKARKKREYIKNRERYIDTEMKYKYGISLEQYKEKLKNQNHVCEICKNPNDSKRRFHVDHCHTTGKVRDILCNHCNRLIAACREKEEILLSSIKYLQKHNNAITVEL